MSTETALLVCIGPGVWARDFAERAQLAERAAQRHQSAVPGDTRELSLYERICEELEDRARRCAAAGSPAVMLSPQETAGLDTTGGGPRHPWSPSNSQLAIRLLKETGRIERLQQGSVVFELRNPFGVGGVAPPPAISGFPTPPRNVWRASSGVSGLRAVAARWEGQLEAVLRDGCEPIVPSGVANRVLTEGLRRYVVAGAGGAVDARVVYRDGSEARPFPLRLLALVDVVPPRLRVLRVALMSMRHSEMDPDVDASWLRNRIVSRVRPQAETDELVYRISLAQLSDLAKQAPIVLWIYQTGLEPAVVGFYRAVVHHLAVHPGSVAVSPRYYRAAGPYDVGTPWVGVQ